MKPRNAWEMLVAHFGSQTEVAKALGANQSTVSRRMSQGKPVTAEQAIAAEQASQGALRRERLRPDLWQESA